MRLASNEGEEETMRCLLELRDLLHASCSYTDTEQVTPDMQGPESTTISLLANACPPQQPPNDTRESSFRYRGMFWVIASNPDGAPNLHAEFMKPNVWSRSARIPAS
jgi:hypothetical protein